MNEHTTVLVVDDNALLRVGLTETISIEPGLEAVGAAANSREALDLYRTLRPDVVTMDYQMPGEDGIKCTQRIIGEFPDAKIILLSVFDTEEDIWRALQAGVKGYLTKKAGEVEDVMDAIHEVAAGGRFFPSHVVEKIERRKNQVDLTRRELGVLRLLADGCSNKEIMKKLDLSLSTVKMHITNLREKLGAADRTQAAVIAFKRGILHLHE